MTKRKDSQVPTLGVQVDGLVPGHNGALSALAVRAGRVERLVVGDVVVETVSARRGTSEDGGGGGERVARRGGLGVGELDRRSEDGGERRLGERLDVVDEVALGL